MRALLGGSSRCDLLARSRSSRRDRDNACAVHGVARLRLAFLTRRQQPRVSPPPVVRVEELAPAAVDRARHVALARFRDPRSITSAECAVRRAASSSASFETTSKRPAAAAAVSASASARSTGSPLSVSSRRAASRFVTSPAERASLEATEGDALRRSGSASIPGASTTFSPSSSASEPGSWLLASSRSSRSARRTRTATRTVVLRRRRAASPLSCLG